MLLNNVIDLLNSKKAAILDFSKRRLSWIFSNSVWIQNVAKQSCRSMKFQKGGHLGFSKFQKDSHLGFFQIVFGSKNVAKQSCRSMKFQKSGHLGFFQIVFGS